MNSSTNDAVYFNENNLYYEISIKLLEFKTKLLSWLENPINLDWDIIEYIDFTISRIKLENNSTNIEILDNFYRILKYKNKITNKKDANIVLNDIEILLYIINNN